MKFQIKRLEIENFRSIQDKVVLDIQPGLFSIEGINCEENSSGNGSGKSTLCAALAWCLTGTTTTNEVLADEVVNLKAGKNCKVTLYIDSDQGEIKITRTRKDSALGNSLFLEIGGQDLSCHKIVETQERLNQLLKISHELLFSTIIMTSGMKSAFSELPPQQRIQVLEGIRDYSVWDRVRDLANLDIKEYNKQIQEHNLTISRIDGSASTYTRMLNNANVELEALINDFKNTDFVNNSTKLSNEISELTADKINILTNINNLESIPAVDVSAFQNSLKEITENANGLKLNIQQLEFSQKDVEREINTIDKWFKNDRCPTCNRLLDRTEEEISTKNTQKTEFLAKKEAFEKQISELNAQVAAAREKYSQVNSEIQDKLKTQNENQGVLSNLRKQIEEIDAKITNKNSQLTVLSNKKDNYLQQKSKLENTITEYTKENEKLSEEKLVSQKVIEDLEKKRNLSDYFYKLLGPKGSLRPYLLNKDIEYLNSCMQKYISIFFKNTNVYLKLNGASIDIIIDNNGIIKSISSLSGGEKKRVNLAIQLSLYDLLCSTAQISFNILFLDEIESELDVAGVEQLIELIEEKAADIESVFWITNNDMVKQNIVKKIICIKRLGKTEVEVQ